jgi:hypothetical protein
MDQMDTAAVEAAIDALYQAPLDRFTADRNALAADLRKRGDRAAADRVKALQKAGATAWAVNQVWWRDRAAFETLLDAGARLRAAHVAFTQGEAADVRAAMEERQRAVAAVIEGAVSALGGPASVAPDARYRIQGTVEALASNGMPSDIPAGRLVSDLQASGLSALGALAGGAAGARLPEDRGSTSGERRPAGGRQLTAVEGGRAGRTAPDAAAQERTRQIADARARLADRELALRGAATDHASSVDAEARARASLERATGRVADLEQQLEAAREEEREVRRALNQAMRTASEAEMMRARTSRDVDLARAALEGLEGKG